MSLLSVAESILNLKFLGLYGKVLVIFCHSIRAATQVRARQKESLYFWLYSYALVLLTGFGGGILANLFLGQPSLLLTNSLLVPLSALAWFLTHHVSGMQDFFTSVPVKLGWGLGHCLFRVFTITAMVRSAQGVLVPDPYYPIPLVGPILAGVMTGSLGMFLPPDKGIAAIQHRCPWPLQGALITAAIYHLAVHDKEGVFGGALWCVVSWVWSVLNFEMEFLGLGGGVPVERWSERDREVGVRVGLLLMWVIMQSGQTLSGPDFNIFQPFYDLLYTVLKIENPRFTAAAELTQPPVEIKVIPSVVLEPKFKPVPVPVPPVPASPEISVHSSTSPDEDYSPAPRRYSTRARKQTKKTQ